MKSKLLSLIAATVTLIGLAGALSCPVYAAEAPKLSAFCDVDGSVTVNCTKDSTDYVFAAFYDSNGCLLDCVVAADQDSITPPKDAASFKAFLLNEEAAPQLPAAELPVSAGFCTVYTETELQNVMNSEDFCGAILGNDFTLTEITIPAGKTLDVPEGTTLTVSGTLHVYGALVNNGKIGNFGFIDVLGGSLINGGTIEGSWNEADECFASSLGIEGGAYIENSGEIHDSVAVADYYREAGEAICEINGDLEITDGYIAVAFGAEPIQSCLTSDKGYDFVMACGTDPSAPNTIELGGITVPEGKSLLLKGSVFDGEHTYENTYQIAEGTALTLSENAALVCVGNGRIVIHGSLDNQGGYVGFGEFEVTGTGDFGNE